MKVLIADDDTLHIDLTSYALRRNGYQVISAVDGEQALRRAERDRPDLILLDIGLPKLDGREVCRRVRARSSTPIIMLTALGSENDIVTGLQAGADDYVVKPFGARQLLARIEALMRRSKEGPITRAYGEVAAGGLTLDLDRHEVRREGTCVQLTPIEFRILHLLATNSGRVIPHSRLLEYAWEFEVDDPGLLRSHLYHIRAKLNLPKRGPGAIRSVSGVGYSLNSAS